MPSNTLSAMNKVFLDVMRSAAEKSPAGKDKDKLMEIKNEFVKIQNTPWSLEHQELLARFASAAVTVYKLGRFETYCPLDEYLTTVANTKIAPVSSTAEFREMNKQQRNDAGARDSEASDNPERFKHRIQ